MELVDPAASDYLWTKFRRWVCSETFKLQEQSYGQAQQNFSNLLKEIEGPVLSKLLKEEVLPLDNAPCSEYRPTSKVQPDTQDLMVPAEALVQKEVIAESSEKHPVSEDLQASSLDRKTLEDLKRSDMLMKERMDKQENKIDAIASMLTQQQETNNQIKGMLEALFTCLPPPS